ncbi:MAG: hypothetical protein IKP73_11265 [Bacteroidales bacterium]|nr:hypothetical protein [Bacteroidales bacterium]
MSTPLSRASNIELLRLVAIFFVILHHLTIKGADTVGYITPYSFEQHGITGIIINSFCICAVNLFLLITGWFGVKNLYKGVVRLVIDCIVFGTISYLCLCSFFDHGFAVTEWFKSSLFTPNRFVTVYMMLLIISPLIERALEGIDLALFTKFIILFTIIEVVFGYVFNYSNGYDLVHFAYMYCLARYLRHTYEEKWNITTRKYSLVIYLVTSVVLAAAFIFLNVVVHKGNDALWFFRYNNPLIIITAISLFLFFTGLNFSNKIINLLATGVFGTFILHTTPYLIPVRNDYTHRVFEQYGYTGVFVVCCLLFAVYCLLFAVDTYKQTDTNGDKIDL